MVWALTTATKRNGAKIDRSIRHFSTTNLSRQLSQAAIFRRRKGASNDDGRWPINQRKGHPATGRPLLLRENSSNGGKAVRTFWRNLMSRKRGVSRNFCEISRD